MNNAIVKAELPKFVNDIKRGEEFTIAFTKMNGEERVYEHCQVHVPYEHEGESKRKGISAQQHIEKGNILFWVPEKGYKIAKAANVSYVELNGVKFEAI